MDEHTLLDSARRVIGTGAAGLSRLEAALGDEFLGALRLLSEVRGRVVVSGIGKSGYVARKIAATLASTGTVAQFLHPTEASHGDLGMLARGDALLILSKSGETSELADLVGFARQHRIPIVAITGSADGTLTRLADETLLLPDMEEGCGSGVVPTTSTLMSMALGDALAISLMHYRGFSVEDFRVLHPGGSLGAQLATVADLMHRTLPLVTGNAPMSDALVEMSAKGFGVVGVTAPDGGLAGIITDGDLRRNMDGLLSLTAAEVMTADPRTIAPDQRAADAARQMNAARITCLFVVDPAESRNLVGLIHIHDCLRNRTR